ncbi:HAMP domain-containing sensor histidine kinase [Clostridium sp. JS66]|uniref:sensor histidine kinase n=1 Tax=Clostridium sp. JS66 TaxID=3064705 RepID=UPI00298EA522|nr:HAMP domain-containing sensor histidine kinase [Clostridium sp. JS66]WPC44705.1 HAMP domain-containing sensor histidine kinase [Clostridium sp. JS66]
MNMGILIPAIVFIYLITINNLYSNVIKSSINFLTKESYSTQLYIASYIEKDKAVYSETAFRNMSPLITTYLSNKLAFRIQMYDASGEILADSISNSVNMYAEDINSAVKGNKSYVVKKIDGQIYILFSSPIYLNKNTIGCVRYVYSIDTGQKLIHSILVIMGIVALAAVVISWILSNLFSENIAEPIKKLKEVSEKVALGNYENKIEIKSGDEIEDLANTFNTMSENIRIYIESLKDEKKKQKDFLDNVTHEFKTPLTAIIGYSDLIPRLEDEKDIEESLVYVKNEGERLLKLVEELLDLSKLGKVNFNIEKTNNNLREIVEETLNIMQPRMNKYGIGIMKDLFDIEISLDRDKTKQVILNILDNAIKYSECTSIDIKMQKHEEKVLLSIIDDGIGIDEQYLDEIFEPLSRVDKINSRNKSGNGLGLTICKEIVEKQGWNIKISSKVGMWTCVKIVFK